jgi:hypothetical protein
MAAIEISVKYTLTGPDGTSVCFNDPSDPNYVGMLTEVTGLDSPDVRESADDLVQMDGGIHGDFFYGRRPITLTGIILNPGTPDIRNARINRLSQASDAMRGDALLTWTPTGGVAQQVAVRRQQPLRVNGAWQKQFQLALVAADPRIYGSALSTSTVTGIIATNLAANPRPVNDQEYGVFGASGYSYVASGGVVAGGGLIAAVATGSSPELGVVVYTQGVLVPSPVTPGQRLVISSNIATPDGGTRNAWIRLSYENSVGGVIGSPVLSTPIPVTAAWTPIVFDTVVPATSTITAVNVRVTAGPTSGNMPVGHRTWVSGTMILRGLAVGAPIPTYFDGEDPRGRWVDPLNPHHSASELLSLTVAGRTYSKTYNFSYGAGAPQGQLLVTNNGNATTYPILRVYGPGNNPILTNYTTGQSIRLIQGVGAGDWLTVDTLNRLVLLNDTVSRYGSVDFANTEWWGLVPGVNDLRFAFDTPLAGSAFRVDWRDASI